MFDGLWGAVDFIGLFLTKCIFIVDSIRWTVERGDDLLGATASVASMIGVDG